MFRFAAVITHATQHHGPMFRELAKVPGLELKVFFCSRFGQDQTLDPGFGQKFAWNVSLTDGYNHEFLTTRKLVTSTRFGEIDNPDLPMRLSDFSPHAMWINGYGCRSYWRAARWAKRRAAVLFFSDSELLHRRSGVKRIVKELLVRAFYRKCAAFITVGDNNETYYRHYGADPSRMFRGCYPVDVDRFEATIRNKNALTREQLRIQLNIPTDALVALFVGKMIPIKRPLDLCEAIYLASLQGKSIHAIFLGDGELKSAAIKRSRELGIDALTHFVGFVNQQEIPLMMAAADVIAMSSEKDPHPLAVTESMIAGNAVVASDRVGCIGPSDTIREFVNGFVYRCGEVNQLADHLISLHDDRVLLEAMQQASRQIAKTQDKRVTIRAILTAIEKLRSEFQNQWANVSAETFQGIQQYCQQLPCPEISIGPVFPREHAAMDNCIKAEVL